MSFRISIRAISAAGLALAALSTIVPVHGQNTPAIKPPKTDEKLQDNLPRAVRHQLLVLPFYSVFDNISFSIEGKRVILIGQVLRPTLKQDAEASIKSIEGVDQVVNNLEVLPTSEIDDELRRGVYRAIFEDGVLAKYAAQNVPAIHIVVKNSTVMLAGTVESEADKALASARVHTVGRVSGVRNELVVRIRNVPGN